MKETKAVATYRTELIKQLKARQSLIRRGKTWPLDQNGEKIYQSSYAIGDTSGAPPSRSVSILASRGANGELTRLIHLLESETE